MEQYRSKANDMNEAIEDFDMDKLGLEFSSPDPSEEVDIGDGTRPRPMFVNNNLSPEFIGELMKLLKKDSDCFAWNYSKMLGLSRELVEHWLPIKEGFKPFKAKSLI
jgi:hypothetical protein